jgi:uncharacterized protein
MSGGSVSKSHIILEITNKFKIKCELKRHLSPTLPGGERTRNEFKKGDIAFLSVGHAFCFFYKDTKVGKDLIPIGKILDNSEELLKAESGDEVSIYCIVD